MTVKHIIPLIQFTLKNSAQVVIPLLIAEIAG